MKILPDRECAQCKKTFTPNRKWTIYCSNSCKMQHYYEKRTNNLETLEAENIKLKEELLKFTSTQPIKQEIIEVVIPKPQLLKKCKYCEKNIDINHAIHFTKARMIVVHGFEKDHSAYFCNTKCENSYLTKHPEFRKVK